MKSGYKLFWSDKALADLQNIINYLIENWTQKEIQNFARRLDKRLELIVINPRLFPKTAKRREVRKSVLTKHAVIYYETKGNVVSIITLFDPRQNPKKLKL
ncbi:MAG: type II toxin-antitoxin system RelE/ParE family toxin [Bacteroidetes bacterium]|nr:type II toxin-antitoxin system RelE/ParE family toxin [Bacteroidota bacterium]MBI3483382.1 type II toxin-antitoxin system RelE/ParE family toxin [Bacteroidota bacterium]